jgi:cyclopropane fatty-acyl-phospholipid synthase-like methyltransferase
MDTKPHAPATARNREPILDVLRKHLGRDAGVLEIGSGTGEHAVYFARELPHLRWQASDVAENLPGIRAWIEDAALPNLPAPVELDVMQQHWPDARFDAVFSANTTHIMSWREVQTMFAQLPRVLERDATLVIYGPFNIGGKFTSASNEAFDAQLRAHARHRGIRDLEAVDALARAAGFDLVEDRAMPANNRCLVWRRSGS